MTLETRAIVVRIDGPLAFVESAQASGCGQCKSTGCGAGKLSGLLCREPRQFQVDNAIGAAVGDEVVVSVADGAVLRGIGLVYLLPLSLLVAGAACGNAIATLDEQRDGYAAAGAALGLVLGFIVSRWLDKRQSRQLPRIVRQEREG
ncbi:MAG TPA: SoxR reducing system RseC family protein [Gallionella sp.]|nr:SoxR reducing system RseC family protein [Gallionella sp.]